MLADEIKSRDTNIFDEKTGMFLVFSIHAIRGMLDPIDLQQL